MTATPHRSAGRKAGSSRDRIYGPLGPGGVEIRNCGASGAHATYCQDVCGGYEGELPDIDNYKYRYYITGKVNDLNSLPSNPKPDDLDLYFPFTLRCHRGVTLSSVSAFKNYAGSDGFTSAHTATALDGYRRPSRFSARTATVTPTTASRKPSSRPPRTPRLGRRRHPCRRRRRAPHSLARSRAVPKAQPRRRGLRRRRRWRRRDGRRRRAAGAALLLAAAAAFVFYRRSKGSSTKQRARGGGDLEEGDDRSAIAFARHEETSRVTQRGMMLASALLSVGSSLPLVGRLCEAAQSCLGSAEEFRRRPATSWSRRSASSTCSTSSR